MKGERTARIISIAAVALISIFFFASSDAANAEIKTGNTTTISINVSKISMVDINPSNLSYPGMEPGNVGDKNAEIFGNYTGIWVENMGSSNLTRMWFSASTPASMPFGTGDPESYDAANMVAILDKDTGSFSFVNRVEFPENDSFYIRTNNKISPGSTNNGDLFGRFRNASSEYFFEFDDDSNNSANCTNGTFWISDAPKTASSTGDKDLKDNVPYTVFKHPSLNFGITEVRLGETEPYYCVAIEGNCKYVMFHRWNSDAPGAGTNYCPNINGGYYINSTASPISPGQVEHAQVNIYVPLGTTHGSLKQGTLTVFVQE